LYLQMVGRVLRKCDGKDDAIVLDHSGATKHHGFVEDPRIWFLEEDRKAESPAQETRAASPSERGLLECSQCSAIRTAGEPCPECGFMPRRPGSYLSVIEGELAQLHRDGTTTAREFSWSEKLAWYAGFLWIAQERGHKQGAAYHQYREKFGDSPPWRIVDPAPPTDEMRAYHRHLMIRYAKRKNRQVAA
jgi:hypothetical protein